ncbi:MAG: hypothetical protein L0Z62_43850 [Gemmataceae bacterium]|nr:hypothetical protein [Gemmataceae bacterium]
MSFLSFLSSLYRLVNQGSRSARRGRRAARQRAVTFRPGLERLEDRTVPETVTWTNRVGGAWNVPDNWDRGIPREADDVVIPDLPGNITITHATGTDAIRSLESRETLVLSGGSLSIGTSGAVSAINSTITGSLTVSGGSLEFKSTTLGGTGTLTNIATLTLTGSTVNAPLVNQGTLVAQASSAINGSFTAAANSTLRVRGSPAGDAVLTVANGFTNRGTIALTSVEASKAATLTVSSGTLTNAVGANLSSLPEAGGSRTLSAQLDNQGILSVAQDLVLTNTGRTLSNSGTIDIASGRILAVNGGSLTNLSAGTLTGGTYHVAGTFKFPDAAITTNAATIVLDGPNAQIVNQADVNALTNFASNTAAGRFTVRNGRNFTTAGAFRNDGSLTIGFGSTFTVTSTLGNFADTTLTGGTYIVGGTFKFPNADLRTNAATLLVLDGPASAIVNQADANALANLANIPAAGSLTLRNGRPLYLTAAFSSAGNLTIDAGSTFTVAGSYTQTAGTLTGAGDLAVAGLLTWTGGTMSGVGQTLANGGMTLGGSADKILTQRTLTNAGAATWTGAGNLVVSSGATFINQAGATFTWTGTGNLAAGSGATFTNQAGATLDAQSDAAIVYESGTAPAVINAGTFRKSAGSGTTRIDASVA